ncbi:uncharacterized protein LOC129302431 [Prosopis cineraria]|uniref:uncharacterized protein LOC129302431 n=1 Tax=Prosopis cineraria TaxID=364024 RepID=UPI00240F3127|nr:uncharacterized protein LOC129302431 [Prosopis cineraria]
MKVGAVLVAVTIACVATNGMSEGRSIVVGDSQGWRAGTNYTDWAIRNSPFRINDTLVFKYAAPAEGRAAQSVYVMPDLWSFVTCDFKQAKLVGSPTEGSGQGFEVQLSRRQPYYFASADANGYDCIAGLTKFVATPQHPTSPFN